MMRTLSRSTLLLFVLLFVLLAGCDSDQGHHEQTQILHDDQPAVLRIVRQDLDRGVVGVRKAADMMARGFLVEDPARQEREIRSVLRRVQEPPHAIDELMVSPISFVAAVGTDGKVIARDAEPDAMRGFDLARAAPVVRRALEGHGGYALSELPSANETDPPSVTVIFAAPARHDGHVVGAIAAGLPLWRLGQQITNQFQLEHAREIRNGELIWALMYRGDTFHEHAGFPPDLRTLAPHEAARASRLAASPGGYTGELEQFGRWYGYGVLPLPSIGPDVGVILFRSDPPR